jgi:tripeptidyl-peptidase-2
MQDDRSILQAPAFVDIDESGLMPKQETQSWDFVRKNPKFDGRGIVVAIFDSGLDPGAPGLQETSDGKRKVIDLLDCSGSGDVETSEKRLAEGGTLALLSGRSLNMSAFSPCPSGEYRVGIKRGYELMPKTLMQRTTSERKEAFQKEHRAHINGLQSRIASLQAKYSASMDSEPGDPLPEMAEVDKAELEELQAQSEQATTLMASWSDPGPLYDVIAWKAADGEWRVVVDTTEKADVTLLKELRVFASSGDFSNFGSENMMNYSVNVWKDGSIVELVVNAGGHGTHVAGIVGAFHGEGDVHNGVAPGCQMIGLKIGDSRLGSMETGTAFVRALIAARERKVDIINVSYGEPAALPNSGRVADLINELVYEHGIIFVTSASNSGPCLTTVGSPGASTHAAIAVGAVVSPAMVAHAYSMRDASERSLASFTWSSRGPSLDGGYGPAIAAPGGAIAPVPNWTLQKNQLMNGTSMASPNACGGITLVLSALKQSNIAYSPSTVRLAVENTAKAVPGHDYTAVGHGLLQVAAAFDYHVQHASALRTKVRVSATLPNRGNARGVILRDAHHFAFDEIEELISVDPHFVESATSQEKIDFDVRYAIRANVPWITTPSYLQLPNSARSFKIQIRPPTLDAATALTGAYFTGEIQGTDMAHPELGPAWVVPVTVIRGAEVSPSQRVFTYPTLENHPGLIHRRFFQVPEGATFAKITTGCHDWPYARIAAFAAQQIIPDQSHKFTLIDKYFSMKGEDQRVTYVPLLGGLTLEVCFGQLWSAMGNEGHLSLSVEFSGVTTEGSAAFSSFDELAKLRVFNALGTNTIQICPKLSAVSRTLYPLGNTPIAPLHQDRDMLTKGRLIYHTILRYQYTTEDAGVKVLLRSPFSQMLYDSPFESQLIMVFDCNKLLVETVDYNPEWFTLPTKGTYTLLMQLRHDDVSVLEKLKSSTIEIERQIPKDKAVKLNVYGTLSAAISGGKKLPADGTKYTTQAHFPIYIQAPSSSATLPTYVRPGDVMYGYVSLVKLPGTQESPAFADCGLDPAAIAVQPIKFVVPSKPTSSASAPPSAAKPTKAPKKTGGRPSAPTGLPVATPPPTDPPGVPETQSRLIVTSSSTPAESPAGSTPATPASELAAPSPAPAEASSSNPKGPITKLGAYNILLQGAVATLYAFVGPQNWTQWAANEEEFHAILPTLRDDPEIKLQHAQYRCYLFRQNPNPNTAADLVSACNAVIAGVDQTALAVYWGTLHPKDPPSARAEQQRIGERLITALAMLTFLHTPGSPEHIASVDEVAKWSDPTGVPILAGQLISFPLPGLGVRLRNLRKKLVASDRPSVPVLQEQLTILQGLGWAHWVKYFQNWITVRSVLKYVPF